MQNLPFEIQQPARFSMERSYQRKAIAERERAHAESELSRATTMAKELERQIEQTNAKARSHRPELQGTRASSSRRKKGLVEATGTRPQQSSTLYVEVMQELDRVKRELRKLQHEVKIAREAKAKAERDAETSTSWMSFDSHVLDGVKRETGEANEEHALVELAGAGRSAKEIEATRTPQIKGIQRDTSRATTSDLEARLTTVSSDAGLRPAETALVRATDKSHAKNDDSSEATAITTRRHEEHDNSSLQAAEAELNSARIELESIKEEGLRFMASIERTGKETARVTEEISRHKEQEKKARAQVQQLNAKLLKARSRLEAVTAADGRADEILSNLKAILQQLDEDTEAAKKENALTELENRCVRTDAESVNAEIAAAEHRIRESVRKLEEVRVSEAVAVEKLKAVVESAMLGRAAVMSQRSGNVTIPRFEYEYLTGRAEVVRAVADNKVAAAEAWVEARQAGEKEMIMRAEAIEREIGEAKAVADVVNDQSAVEQRPCDGLQRAHPSGRPVRESGASATSGRKNTTRAPSSSSSVARNPRAPSFSIKRKRRRVLIPNYLKLITGRCRGQN